MAARITFTEEKVKNRNQILSVVQWFQMPINELAALKLQFLKIQFSVLYSWNGLIQ